MRVPGGGHAAAGPGADGAPDPGGHVERSLSAPEEELLSCYFCGDASRKANAHPVAASGGPQLLCFPLC